jgi:hypothetical protein
MRIERVEIDKATLESFCDDNMLTVVITEFESRLGFKAGNIEYKTKIKDFYLQRKGTLVSIEGYGATEDEALKKLLEVISSRTIANGVGDDAVVIKVPKLTKVWNNGMLETHS